MRRSPARLGGRERQRCRDRHPLVRSRSVRADRPGPRCRTRGRLRTRRTCRRVPGDAAADLRSRRPGAHHIGWRWRRRARRRAVGAAHHRRGCPVLRRRANAARPCRPSRRRRRTRRRQRRRRRRRRRCRGGDCCDRPIPRTARLAHRGRGAPGRGSVPRRVCAAATARSSAIWPGVGCSTKFLAAPPEKSVCSSTPVPPTPRLASGRPPISSTAHGTATSGFPLRTTTDSSKSIEMYLPAARHVRKARTDEPGAQRKRAEWWRRSSRHHGVDRARCGDRDVAARAHPCVRRSVRSSLIAAATARAWSCNYCAISAQPLPSPRRRPRRVLPGASGSS